MLRMINAEHSFRSVEIANALFSTHVCDDFADMSELRASYRKRIGNDALVRLDKGTETRADVALVEQTVYHYHEWTKNSVWSALPYKWRFAYWVNKKVGIHG